MAVWALTSQSVVLCRDLICLEPHADVILSQPIDQVTDFMLRHVGVWAQQHFFDSARGICAHSLVGEGEMPCSICGQTGHNALSCHKKGAPAVEAAAGLTADAAAAGLTADGKHHPEAAQCHPSADSETSSAEPQAKQQRSDDVSNALIEAPLDLPRDDEWVRS